MWAAVKSNAPLLPMYMYTRCSDATLEVCQFEQRVQNAENWKFILQPLFADRLHFDCCIMAHTTACQHAQVYDFTPLRQSVPPTWRRRRLLFWQNDVAVIRCIATCVAVRHDALAAEADGHLSVACDGHRSRRVVGVWLPATDATFPPPAWFLSAASTSHFAPVQILCDDTENSRVGCAGRFVCSAIRLGRRRSMPRFVDGERKRLNVTSSRVEKPATWCREVVQTAVGRRTAAASAAAAEGPTAAMTARRRRRRIDLRIVWSPTTSTTTFVFVAAVCAAAASSSGKYTPRAQTPTACLSRPVLSRCPSLRLTYVMINFIPQNAEIETPPQLNRVWTTNIKCVFTA